MDSFPNHIKDQIYLYIWLYASKKVNTEYHNKFYFEDMLYFRRVKYLPNWKSDYMACNRRYLSISYAHEHYVHIYRIFDSIVVGILPKNYF